MHEFAIARNICSTVLEEMETRGLSTVARIGLSIGALSGVVADALAFSFEAIKADTLLAETQLEIERCPGQGLCLACNAAFEVHELVFQCPHCSSPQVRVNAGQELDITYLEVPE